MFAEILLGLGMVYLAWSLIAMKINYRRALSIGILLVRLPVDPMNIAWLILEPPLWRLLIIFHSAEARSVAILAEDGTSMKKPNYACTMPLPGHSLPPVIFTFMSPILMRFMTCLFAEPISSAQKNV